MLVLFVLLSCFFLFAAGTAINKELFLADMTCRYYAHHVSQKRWDSGPLRLKEHKRAYRLCTMKIFQPHSISLLTDLFVNNSEERHKVYARIAAEYTVIKPMEPILRIFSYDTTQDAPLYGVTRVNSTIACIGSNGSTFPQGSLGSVFDEVVFLEYFRAKLNVERIAKRMAVFQQNVIPEATVENLIAFHRQRLRKYSSVFLESALPIKKGTVELCLDRATTDYSPRALGADFATEFGLLYHLVRSSSHVSNDKAMLEGLRHFFPKLSVSVALPYVPTEGSDVLKVVPWAPPFHPIHPHRPQLRYLFLTDGLPNGPWRSEMADFDGVIFPDYSKRQFIVCRLGPASVSVSGERFAASAKVSIKNPPNTSDRRLLIAHLLRTEYSSDLIDPNTKQRHNSIDWYFDALNK